MRHSRSAEAPGGPSADCNELCNADCRMETPQHGRPSKLVVTDFSRRSVAPRSQEPGLAQRCEGVDKECALAVPDFARALADGPRTAAEHVARACWRCHTLITPRGAVLCVCARVRAGGETRRSRPPTDHPQSLVIVASKSRSLLKAGLLAPVRPVFCYLLRHFQKDFY